MKIIFMTNPDTLTALPYLKALLQSRHRLIGIVTPKRGLKKNLLRSFWNYGMSFFVMRLKGVLRARVQFWRRRSGLLPDDKEYLSVEEFLLDHSLPHLKPASLKEAHFLQELQKGGPDLILVSTLSQKLEGEILRLPRYGCVNLHAGILPQERGPAGPFWALYYDQTKTGVTFHQMTGQFDQGDILFQKEVPVLALDTEASLSQRIAQAGAQALSVFLDQLEKGSLHPRPQGKGEFRRRPYRQERKELQVRLLKRKVSHFGIFKRIFPVTATPIHFSDVSTVFKMGDPQALFLFEEALARYVNRRFAVTTGSGKGALYLILKTLSRRSPKREVVLPAYTDAGLILSIQKAGCIPRLCDISLEYLNFSLRNLERSISQETLAVVLTEMFGFSSPLEELLAYLKTKKIPTIEDSAQSFGGGYQGRRFGSLGDVSFVSFGKGKNLPTFGGGAILTDDVQWAQEMKQESRKLPSSFRDRFSCPFLLLGQAAVVRPWIYGTVRGWLSPFRSRSVPKEIHLASLTAAQARVGLSLLKRLDALTERRRQNGFFWYSHLKTVQGLRVPQPADPDGAGYPQFPILFEEVEKRKRAQGALEKIGVESSIFYPYALHHLFPELGEGKGKDPFPNATWVSQRLLTLPVHPFLDKEHLLFAARCLKETLE